MDSKAVAKIQYHLRHTNHVLHMIVSPSGQSLLAVHGTGEECVCQVFNNSGAAVCSVPSGEHMPPQIAPSQDAFGVMQRFKDGSCTFCVHALDSGVLIGAVTDLASGLTLTSAHHVLGPHGRTAVLFSKKAMGLYSIVDDVTIHEWKELAPSAMTCSANWTRLYVVGNASPVNDGFLRTYDLESGKCIGDESSAYELEGIDVSEDGSVRLLWDEMGLWVEPPPEGTLPEGVQKTNAVCLLGHGQVPGASFQRGPSPCAGDVHFVAVTADALLCVSCRSGSVVARAPHGINADEVPYIRYISTDHTARVVAIVLWRRAILLCPKWVEELRRFI